MNYKLWLNIQPPSSHGAFSNPHMDQAPSLTEPTAPSGSAPSDSIGDAQLALRRLDTSQLQVP